MDPEKNSESSLRSILLSETSTTTDTTLMKSAVTAYDLLGWVLETGKA